MGRKITAVIICAAAGALLLGSVPSLAVQAGEEFAICFEEPEESYVLLPAEDSAVYEVAEGDSLWNIAERLWGDGKQYPALYELNKEMVKEPDLIYPGEELKTARPLYLKKHPFRGMEYRDVFRFDAPSGCTVGVMEEGEAWASCVQLGEGYYIACNLREKTQAQERLRDFEAWEREVSAYLEKEYADNVRYLDFETYLAEDGGIVYLYSYIYSIDLSPYGEEGAVKVLVSAGVRQTAHMQAEFVGFTMKQEDLADRVRYMTASFEELMPEGAVCTVDDNNIRMSPEVKWEAETLNAPAWVDAFFDGMLKQIYEQDKKEKSRKEKLLDKMKENGGKGQAYGGKKEAGD